MLGKIKTTLHEKYVKTAGKLGGALTESRFIKEGMLTHDEFVEAGDLLVFKCPSWSWETGQEKGIVKHLPKDKQFLITRKVPCVQRATDLENSAMKTTYASVDVDGDDDWVCAVEGTSTGQGGDDDDIPEIDGPGDAKQEAQEEEEDSDSSDIPDMDSFDEENLVEEPEDPASAFGTGGVDNILRTRTYDISITYDNYYKTPKVWLFGYDEEGKPLTATQIFEDISEDHAKKTVTMDAHPHLGVRFAYIHPCRHASVMKSFVDRQMASGKGDPVSPASALIIFLKLLSAVCPTIEIDSTHSIKICPLPLFVDQTSTDVERWGM